MRLMTKALAAKLPRLYATEHTPVNCRTAYAKFFHPLSNWTWYVLEYDGVDLCFGLVDGHEREFGYFSLKELSEISVRGVSVERDKWFRPVQMQDLLNRRGQGVA